MAKIYRRSDLVANTKSKKKKDEKVRRRNVIVNFRVSPQEKALIDQRIRLSGLKKSTYFIESCLYGKVLAKGNVRTFDEIRESIVVLDRHLQELQSVEELDLEKLESLRMVLELLDAVLGKESGAGDVD